MVSALGQDALLLAHHLGADAHGRKAMTQLVTTAELLYLKDLGMIRPVLDSRGHATTVVLLRAPSPTLTISHFVVSQLGPEGTETRLRDVVDAAPNRLLDVAYENLVSRGHLRSERRRLRRAALTLDSGQAASLFERATTDRSAADGGEGLRAACLVLLCSAVGANVDQAIIATLRRTVLGLDGELGQLLDGLMTALVLARAQWVGRS